MSAEANDKKGSSMNSIAEFSERDLRAIFNRALTTVAICTLIGLPFIAWEWGWRSLLLYLLGAAIAASGVIEWRRLSAAIFSRMEASDPSGEHEAARPPRAIGRVLLWFFVRLLAAAVLLYVSLRRLGGSPIALILGLALAMLALLIEALRLFHAWSA